MSFEFTKENIDLYLKELAEEYRKQVGKGMPAEIILIGTILIFCSSRTWTTSLITSNRKMIGRRSWLN